MLRILKPRIFGLKLLIKSTLSISKEMELPNQIVTIDYTKDQYGDYPIFKSTFQSHRKWTPIIQIDEKYEEKQVLVRARVHNIRAKGNSCFIVLRQAFSTIQALAFKGDVVSKDMIKYMGAVSNQSIVDLLGIAKKPEKPIQSCSQQMQLQILKFFVVNRAVNRLPLQIIDASRKVFNNEFNEDEDDQQNKPEQIEFKKQLQSSSKQKQIMDKQTQDTQKNLKKLGKQGKQGKQGKNKKQEKQKQVKQAKQATVKMTTRLNNRVIDLRTTAKQAIFRISSGVCQLFRQFLLQRDFVQIHTPKLIGGSSQGGSNVFTFNYFNRKACLAQSPQLYKQMCVMGDFHRVFEIGPVFRAENSFTHRHMCQFVGLDLEMTIKEHYFQLLDFFGQLFPYIFENLTVRFEKQLKAVNQQFQFEPFQCKVPVVKLTFQEGISLLKQNDILWPEDEDLNTQTEKKLGQLVRIKYGTDFYMLHRYPVSARPFYTTLCQDNPKYTCSYDFFMRGEEILSGAQRIYDPVTLEKRAIQKGMDPKSIQDYIDCFRYGAYPHGGGGIGLERVVMLFCGLKNIRNSSLFPRDPKRINP